MEPGTSAESFFNAKAFVPLRHALGAREGSDFELACIPSNAQMSDGYILRLAGARGDNRSETSIFACFQGRVGLGNSAGLVRLDQNRVHSAPGRRGSDAARVCD